MTSNKNYEKVATTASDTVAQFEDDRNGFAQKLQHRLHKTPSLVPLIVLLGSIAIFGILIGDRFFSPFTLTLILQQVQIVGIVAAAQSLVILTAGIDLSVGAIMVISSVVMGQFSFRYGIPVEISIVCGLIAGTFIGYVNGFLIAVIKLPPFIVTLGMWQIVLASNFLYSKNETIRNQDLQAEADALLFFANNFRVGAAVFTYGVVFMVVLIAALAYVLRHTAWGRHVYAVGDDPEAAELAGVNVKRTLISVYMLTGLICAFAGWVLVGRIGSVSPTSGQLANIDSITAVVIGGISLFGGRGSILGTMFGALIVGVFTMGLRQLGADSQWTYLLIGVLIISAVAVDQWIRKVAR
jgi:fructose transport system permease protein